MWCMYHACGCLQPRVHIQAREGYQVPCSVTLPVSLQQGWQPKIPSNLPVSISHSTGGAGTGAHGHALLLLWYCGCDLRSSCLYGKTPHSQAISPTQGWSLALVFRAPNGTAVDVSFSLLIRTFVIIRSEQALSAGRQH